MDLVHSIIQLNVVITHYLSLWLQVHIMVLIGLSHKVMILMHKEYQDVLI